jgi:hypothetical protein
MCEKLAKGMMSFMFAESRINARYTDFGIGGLDLYAARRGESYQPEQDAG